MSEDNVDKYLGKGYMARSDVEFQKLAVRGITIIIADGDTGYDNNTFFSLDKDAEGDKTTSRKSKTSLTWCCIYSAGDLGSPPMSNPTCKTLHPDWPSQACL